MKLNGIIVCDDIREEIGGKVTLAGVYSGGLLLDKSTTFPSLMKSLCVFLRVYLEDGDPVPEKVIVRGSFNAEQILEHTGNVSVANRAEPITLRMAFVPFTLRGFGAMTFKFTLIADGKEVSSFEERVTIAPNPG